MNVPPLVLRLEKGSAITHAENDYNLRTLRDFCDALASIQGIVLDPDGTLKDGAVDNAAAMANRIVTAPKLYWTALPYWVATGTNAYEVVVNNIDQPFDEGDGAADSWIAAIKFTNGNTVTAPTTLTVKNAGGTTLATGDLKRNGSASLEYNSGTATGTILAGQIYWVAWDGTRFQLLGMASMPTSAPTNFTLGYRRTWTGISIPGVGSAIPAITHGCVDLAGAAVIPTHVTVRYRCTAPAGVLGYSLNDVVQTVDCNSATQEGPWYALFYDTSTIGLRRHTSVNIGDLFVAHKTTGVWTSISEADWSIEITAWV